MTQDNMDLDAGGVKFDSGKVRMDLLPPDALMAIAQVFTYGAIKYDDWNWAKGMRAGRILAAFDRHKSAYLLGEEYDEESGYPHLWHMGCCVLMLISADLRGVLTDDRAKIATIYLDALRDMMGEGNDPRGTPKNAGGSVVETPAAEKWMGLSEVELEILRCISEKRDHPFTASVASQAIEVLRGRRLAQWIHGELEITDHGLHTLTVADNLQRSKKAEARS